MEHKDSSKPRRQLPAIPVPPTQSDQQPVLPTIAETPVTPATFYSSSNSTTSKQQQPPPLPARRHQHGSSFTNYQQIDGEYREPELVQEDQNPLPPQTVPGTWSTAPEVPSAWGSGRPEWDQPTDVWHDAWNGEYQDWGELSARRVNIDGRVEEEELNWWDPSVGQIHNRPGPGILPTLLESYLHNADHTLFSVSASPPDVKPRHRSSESHPPTPHPPFNPPTPDEVRRSVPHPNAYYCHKHNGWVLLLWKSSIIEPPLSKSYDGPPLPDIARRLRSHSCIGESATQANKTHHFHYYKAAVDASKITTPFKRADWERHTRTKSRRRQAVLMDHSNLGAVGDSKQVEGELLDLYVCCQCSLYCVVLDAIPGVIPQRTLDAFMKEKQENPHVGKTPVASLAIALDTILMIIEDRLWKGETRALPVHRNSFQSKLGWSENIEDAFRCIGFNLERMNNEQGDLALHAPVLDSSTPEGPRNRAKLLRAWIELSALLASFTKRYAVELVDQVKTRTAVKIDSVRELYQTAIGAHPEQLPRGGLPETLRQARLLDEDWRTLGLTPSSYTPELLTFAYLAQCRCDPGHTIRYFTALVNIVQTMQMMNEDTPMDLQNLILDERSRGRFTQDDLLKAVGTLGFGHDGPLRVDFDDSVEEEFIINAWRDGIRRSWKDETNGSATRRELNDALKVIADARGSREMYQVWERERGSIMTVDTAYSTLGVSKEMDENTLITVFDLRMEEQANQVDKLREALSVIAQATESQRLKVFLDTGRDPGDVVVLTRPDMPRGLHQLGNTCYLNSLLQYFYTIRDLRETVASLSAIAKKSPDVLDDDLDTHRVGGRLVTRREIARSRRFVTQLADLFWNLEYCGDPAVKPSIELAKLALVTSKDEEEEGDKAGTDSSNDTDVTLVEDGSTRISAPLETTTASPIQTSFSILGKRSRGTGSKMDIDDIPDVDKDKDYVIVSKPGTPVETPEEFPPDSQTTTAGDVEMSDMEKPGPAEPVRKGTTGMMFGRQHDVSECMDSCLFQLECAELIRSAKLSGGSNPDIDKTSIVKRLFYGRIRQRIMPDGGSSRSSIHEKEDLFSHLPVNVSEEGIDIYDGLSRYFNDTVEFEGKKAHMEVSLVDLPPILQIQLQRVQFDRERLQAFKSQAYIQFRETISMDRFLENSDQEKKQQSNEIQAKLNGCRERIRQLTEAKHRPFDLALTETCDFLSRNTINALPGVDQELLASLRYEAIHAKKELEEERRQAAELKLQLEDIWKDESQALYELTSVFIHRGESPSWGHYFFYSRNLPDHPDEWFKYNDSDVSVVSKGEVLTDTTGSTANPYLLVFARKGSEVIHTVKRFEVGALEEASTK